MQRCGQCAVDWVFESEHCLFIHLNWNMSQMTMTAEMTMKMMRKLLDGIQFHCLERRADPEHISTNPIADLIGLAMVSITFNLAISEIMNRTLVAACVTLILLPSTEEFIGSMVQDTLNLASHTFM